MELQFPSSRECLWDSTATGAASLLSPCASRWVCVRVSSAAVELAVRHARQSGSTLTSCFLIATSWITPEECLVFEADRFDPGRRGKQGAEGLSPTALIVGDFPILCQVVIGSEERQLTLQQPPLVWPRPPAPLDPASLLTLCMQCCCAATAGGGAVVLRCSASWPSPRCEATPISAPAVVQTALARNLTGPLPLSALQSRVRHGYLTMETTRKLVLLLHSDPKCCSLPLVGVWVSGVSSLQHPAVWAACLLYHSSPQLVDRVDPHHCLLLLYCEGRPRQPDCWQCSVHPGGAGLQLHTGSAHLQAGGEEVVLELMPNQELHTPAKTSSATVSCDQSSLSCDMSCDLPKPSPLPVQQPRRLTRDAELSCLSEAYAPTTTSSSSIAEPALVVFPDKLDSPAHQLLRKQEQQLKGLQEKVDALLRAQSPPHKHTTSEAGTSTGESLMWPHHPPHPHTSTGPPPNESTRCSSVAELSVATATSTLSESTQLNLDLRSLTVSSSEPDSSRQLQREHFYQHMLTQVQQLLCSSDSLLPDTSDCTQTSGSTLTSGCHKHRQTPSSTLTSGNHEHRETEASSLYSDEQSPLGCYGAEPGCYAVLHPDVLAGGSDLSVLPVPRVQCAVAMETTVDENVQLADMIALKYLDTKGTERQTDSPSGHMTEQSAHMSLATQQYLQRHSLMSSGGERASKVLDITRLKTLPKLI